MHLTEPTTQKIVYPTFGVSYRSQNLLEPNRSTEKATESAQVEHTRGTHIKRNKESSVLRRDALVTGRPLLYSSTLIISLPAEILKER